MSELLELATLLVGTPSLSHAEGPVAELVAERLGRSAHLEVVRLGDNVVARTRLGRAERVLIAGHLDTVASPAGSGLVEGDVLYGRGAADMKGTLAVMVTLAEELLEPRRDVTWVFYAREEVARSESGLLEIAERDASLLEANVAILGEPTGGVVEAGCQGTLRIQIRLGGVAAHSARPYRGRNALTRLAPVLSAVAAASAPRVVELDGVTFSEQLEAVGVTGGMGGNVIPDEATLTINHRFAPDRTGEEALAWVASILEPHLEEGLDELEVIDLADGARPGLDHPVLAELVARSGGPTVAKVGWTDVATFAARGVPAANFGAGDPELAHHRDEQVSASELEHVAEVLRGLLGSEMDAPTRYRGGGAALAD